MKATISAPMILVIGRPAESELCSPNRSSAQSPYALTMLSHTAIGYVCVIISVCCFGSYSTSRGENHPVKNGSKLSLCHFANLLTLCH